LHRRLRHTLHFVQLEGNQDRSWRCMLRVTWPWSDGGQAAGAWHGALVPFLAVGKNEGAKLFAITSGVNDEHTKCDGTRGDPCIIATARAPCRRSPNPTASACGACRPPGL